MLDLPAHLDKLARLLALERRAEEERFEEARATLSLAERDARGTALAQLEAVDESALSGRALITYARPEGGELGGARMGTGSPVRLLPRRELPAGSEEPPRGVVARRTRAKISVAFDREPPDWATEGRVGLELLPNPQTHERMLGALTRIKNTPEGKRWHSVLSGGPARFESPLRAGTAEATEEARLEAGLDARHLNPEQAEAVRRSLRAKDLLLLHGPPGTGKTTVLVEIVRRAVARGELVLGTAPSNLAVDNLVERLADAGLNCVRLGHPARVLPSVLDQTLDEKIKAHPQAVVAKDLVREALRLKAQARKQRARGRSADRFAEARSVDREANALFGEARRREEQAEEEVLSRAQVILATLTGLERPDLARRRFGLAVIDEATQAVEPAALLAMLKADRAVLAGDHQQLPPTILSQEAAAAGLAVSLFERLVRGAEGKGAAPDSPLVTLAEQHRMHEKIMYYPSQALYGGRLRAHPDVAQRALDDAPLVVLDTAGRGWEEETPEGSDSKLNPGEADLCAAEARALLAFGVTPGELAIIAPYDAQVQRLRSLLEEFLDQGLEIDTVDGFQGREKDAVIVSLVRSNDRGELGFLTEVRRMNVALTRARKKLIVVGDGALLARHPFYDGFFEHARNTGAWVSAWER